MSKRPLPRSLRGALAVLAPGARAYTVKGQKIVSTLPHEALARQLGRTPDLIRFVYMKDGRRQSFIITAKRGWQSKHGSKRIKAFGKDWTKRLESWQADFLKRFQKSAPESEINIVGFEPIWGELE